jgi:hypothetical protein
LGGEREIYRPPGGGGMHLGGERPLSGVSSASHVTHIDPSRPATAGQRRNSSDHTHITPHTPPRGMPRRLRTPPASPQSVTLPPRKTERSPPCPPRPPPALFIPLHHPPPRTHTWTLHIHNQTALHRTATRRSSNPRTAPPHKDPHTEPHCRLPPCHHVRVVILGAGVTLGERKHCKSRRRVHASLYRPHARHQEQSRPHQSHEPPARL